MRLLFLFYLHPVAMGNEPPPEGGCILNQVTGPALTSSWSNGAANIAVQGDTTDGFVWIEARAWFGGLEYQWSTGPHSIGADECEILPFSVPGEAFLHPLATEYVTDLLVRVIPIDDENNPMQETALPVAYAIWPNGSEEDATLWDREAMQTNAPLGVLDPTGRHTPAGGLIGRIVRMLPPIAHEINLPRTEPDDERTTRTVVPADDNRDEGVQ